jgi:hypothetical protein
MTILIINLFTIIPLLLLLLHQCNLIRYGCLLCHRILLFQPSFKSTITNFIQFTTIVVSSASKTIVILSTKLTWEISHSYWRLLTMMFALLVLIISRGITIRLSTTKEGTLDFPNHITLIHIVLFFFSNFLFFGRHLFN